MLVLMTGCEATQKAFKSPSELKTPDLFREIDPTGAISEGEARKETWETITKKMKALDVEGLNRAVVELADATRTLSQRMESVPAADLQTLSENLAAAAVSIRSQVEALQLDQTLHIEDDPSKFLPARGQGGEVVAGVFIRKPARVQNTVRVPRQVHGIEPGTFRGRQQPHQHHDELNQEHQASNPQPNLFRFARHGSASRIVSHWKSERNPLSVAATVRSQAQFSSGDQTDAVAQLPASPSCDLTVVARL